MALEVTYRITEGLDSRTTELGDSRITENGDSSANLQGSCSVSDSVSLKHKVTTNLLGVGDFSGTGIVIPFVSTCYAKIGGVWKQATVYVKHGGNWEVPTFGAIKTSSIWKRVL